MTWRRGTRLVTLAITVLPFASCRGHTSASTTTAQEEGTVVGVYGTGGGLAPRPFHPFSGGFITLTNDAHHYLRHISGDGQFRLSAAPGTYDVAGFTNAVGGGTCGRATVRVQANRTTSLTVTCQILER